MEFYAKSDPVETIKEHTDELLRRYEVVKEQYADKLPLSDRDWELLRLAVRYHDVGKADAFFQNKIRRAIGEPEIHVNAENDVQHNYLSILAIPTKELALTKEEEKLVMQVIAYHHERDRPVDVKETMENYKGNVLPIRSKLEKVMEIPIEGKLRQKRFDRITEHQRFRPSDGDIFKRYVLLKGLLHRLDHAASAHVPVELATDMKVGDNVTRFMDRAFDGQKKPLQQFTESHQDKHIVVTAQTGMGKTEAGLLWLGDDKGFFTLPLRVSINAMYDRITNKGNIGFTRDVGEGEEATGLLHSTSLDYLLDTEEASDAELEKVHAQSKEFANKLVVSTVDQILKFPFYYLGFEKEYATLASSKVIIDELQSYDPKIAALLVRAMTLIDKIGGSFLIMTATLPDFYFKALQRELSGSNRPLVHDVFLDDTVQRHNVSIRDTSILDIAEEAATIGEKEKVLVICNTVDQARAVYTEMGDCNVRLLHSRFTQNDRKRLEEELLSFEKGDKPGVWVTTQLVEASLDIDFDVLFTEMAPLDSLFQRFGRCNRKGQKSIDDLNVHVLTEEVSGVKYVYNEDIYDRSLALIQEKNGLLLETEKIDMIQALYDEEALIGSSFKEEFDDTLQQLKGRTLYTTKKQEAQELLRNIQQKQIIPEMFLEYEDVKQAMEDWSNANKRYKNKREAKAEKRRARRIIEGYTVGIHRFKDVHSFVFPLFKGLEIAQCKYDSDHGLLTEELEDPFS